MSVFIRQEPTSPNVAYTKLLYVVTGSSTVNNPQHKFVCDINDFNGNLISRLRQSANKSGSAVFDISVPIRARLKPDDTSVLKTTTIIPVTKSGDNDNITSYDQFNIAFGEEWGVSTSSSVVVYDGNGSVGDPAVSASNISIFRGTVEPYKYGWFNPTTTSTASALPESSSFSGSLTLYNYETTGTTLPGTSSYADTNLLVSSSITESRLFFAETSASFDYSGSTVFHVEVYSAGVSSSAYTYQLIIDNLTDQLRVATFTGVTGSAGPGTQVLISTDFTASVDKVYGIRAAGVWTSSFSPPVLTAGYSGSDNADWESSLYPMWPGYYVNASGSDSTIGYEIIENKTSTTTPSTRLQVWPNETAFSASLPQPINPPNLTSPVIQSWNFNFNYGQIGWAGIAAGQNDNNILLTNWCSQDLLSIDDNSYYEKYMKPVADTDYACYSFLNTSGSADIEIGWKTFSDPNLNTGSNSYIWTGSKYPGGGVVNDVIPALAEVSGSGSTVPFITIPGGMAQLNELDGPLNDWVVGEISVVGTALSASSSESIDHSFYFYRDNPCDYEDRFNFAFINEYGVWDTIGFNTTAVRRNATINTRAEFRNAEASYDSSISLYDVQARGIQQYYLSQEDEYEVTTPYILDFETPRGYFNQSNFYKELVTSPNVMLQVDSEFVPIIITNSNFRYRTNIKGQKQFTVTIRFKYSNKRRSRT